MKFKKKSTKSSLSDKIASALTVKPRDDIEDDQVFGTKPEIVSRADFSSSDSDDEAVISEFRKRNVSLLSEINKKYEGKVVSRKFLAFHESDKSDEDSDSDNELENGNQALPKKNQNEYSKDAASVSETHLKKNNPEDELESQSDSESDDYSITRFHKQDNSDESEVNDTEEEDDDEGEGYDISQMSEPINEDFEHIKKQNVSEEVKKGVSVKNQLILWEGLLEMRIHLQRCMNTANQMPMPDTLEELKQIKEFVEECNVTKVNVSTVLDKLMSLQNILLRGFPETKSISLDKHEGNCKNETNPATESDEEIPSDTDNEEIPSDTDDENKQKEKKSLKHVVAEQSTAKKRKLEDYNKDLEKTHKAFKSFRDATIQKWNDKTRLATANNKNTSTNTILQQISYILSDKNKLIRRTQLKRSEYDIVGYKKESNVDVDEEHNGLDVQKTKDRKDNDEYISEIFDDSDFYHQLLRELIECKSADISDPIQLSRQWIALQQMRSKMKRKVDTKATKGRKIKYVVHNKLVNFMAPEKSLTWDDDTTNELYSSLFGKMYEQNNLGVNANLQNIKIINN